MQRLASGVAARARRPEWVASAMLLVATVIVLPVVGYFVNEQPASPGAEATMPAIAAPSNAYAVAESRLFPVGGGAVEIAPRAAVAEGEPAETLSAFVAGADGDMWLVDWPASINPDVRVRRITAVGDLAASFTVPTGAAIFVPAPDGGLWVDFAAGEGSAELIRHYSASGEVLAEHALPQGLFARWITFGPDGSLWVQLEESEVDVKTFVSTYRSRLVPILDAAGTPVSDPGGGTIDGSFFGSDGWLYLLEVDPVAPDADQSDTQYRVKATSPQGEKRTYVLPTYHRPFAADDAGRVYSEPVGKPLADDYYRNSIGDAVLGTAGILVTSAEGAYATFEVARPDGLIGLHPSVSVLGNGTIWSASRDGSGFWLHRWADGGPFAGVPSDAEDIADAAMLAGLAPTTLDPYCAPDPQIEDLMRLVFAGLVRHGPGMEPIPDLAQSVPAPGAGISADGLTLTYQLRSGITWHDGRPVTGADVVATWEYLKRPSAVGRTAPFPGFDLIASVTADGQSVTVTLSEPFGAGPEAFFPYVLPAHLLADPATSAAFWVAPVGCGPYAFASIPTPKRWQLTAHASSPRGVVSLNRLDVRFATEDAALALFESSPVPIIWQWPQPSALPSVRRDMVGEMLRVPTGRWVGIVINPARVPSIGMRQAIIASYPATRLAEELLPVSAEDAAPALYARVAGVRPEQQSVALTSSGSFGYTCGLRFGWPELSYEQITMVEEAWAAGGFTVDRTVGRRELYSPWTRAGTLARGTFDVAGGTFPAPPDAGWGGLFDAADAPSSKNPSGEGAVPISDRDAVALYARARGTYDRDERVAISLALQDLLRQRAVLAFDRAEYREIVTLGSIEGYEPQAYPAGDFWNVEAWTIGGDG